MTTYTKPSLFKKISLNHVKTSNGQHSRACQTSIENDIFNASIDAEYDDVNITNSYIESMHVFGAYE